MAIHLLLLAACVCSLGQVIQEVGPGHQHRGRSHSLRCLWTLLTCESDELTAGLATLRAQLPQHYAAVHARLAHNTWDVEGALLAGLGAAPRRE